MATSPLVPGCGKDNELCFELVQPKPDPCLATMEAAMKAMEPFITGTRHINLPMSEQDKDAYFRDRLKGYAQWDAAKTCWKGQP